MYYIVEIEEVSLTKLNVNGVVEFAADERIGGGIWRRSNMDSAGDDELGRASG
jgi:hypothetical protein